MELTNASYKLVDAVNKSSFAEFEHTLEAQGHQVNAHYLKALQTINETQKRALQETLKS